MAARNAPARTEAPPPSSSAPRSLGPKLLARIAARFHVDGDKMAETLKQTAFRQKSGPPVTNEQLMALLVVADQYNLNPFTKEIYAFASDGGITPIVGVDGWIRITNEHTQYAGHEFEYPGADVDEDDQWIECRIFRKDRERPIVAREYLIECRRDTGPWKSHPRRMLRHKAFIQAARLAFGFGGIYDPDEAERINDAMAIEGEVTESRNKPAVTAPQSTISAPALTHVPIGEWRSQIDRIGVGENAVCERFEVGALEEIPLKLVPQVNEYLHALEQAAGS